MKWAMMGLFVLGLSMLVLGLSMLWFYPVIEAAYTRDFHGGRNGPSENAGEHQRGNHTKDDGR